MKKQVKVLISLITIALASFIFSYTIYATQSYPLGNDVYGHLFKIDTLYKSIQNGIWYPIYTPNWYSGIELFRYWPPASYYFYCGIMYFTKDIYSAFIVFAFITYFISAAGFLLFGIREDRIVLCTILGIIFPLLPDNMRVFFAEGNIPRIFITMILPYYFFYIYEYLYYKRFKALIRLSLITMIIVASHIMISAMLGLTSFIIVLYYAIINKEIKQGIKLLINLVLSYIPSAIILIPGLLGGIVTQNSTASTETSGEMWSEKAINSLNPYIRTYNLDMFYFGLSLMIILILGLLVFRKRIAPSFLTTLTIFIGTTLIVLPILSALPLSQVFWMIRFIPMAEIVLFIGIIYWKELRKSTLIIFISIIILDLTLSFRFFNIVDCDVNTREEKMSQEYCLDEAANITSNKLGIMDLSNFGSYTSYFLTQNNNNINSIFGWAYQGAYTIKEIVNLNDSFEMQYYNFMFSRLIEYGCDTVIFKKDEIKNMDELIKWADNYQYSLINETEKAMLFKRIDIDTNYGVISDIENVCIGTGSEYLSLLYPSFHKLRNENLDEYTYDELKDYKKIYISGPYYDNKEYCEGLVQKLANNGTKIYIDVTNLKDDLSRGRNSFLGVVAQPITFTKEFPILEKNNGSQFKLKFYSDKYKEWTAAYFTNIDKILKQSEYANGKYLTYLGKSANDNITFIGLNLIYYCFENKNNDLYDMLDEIFNEKRDNICKYTIVPLQVTYGRNYINIFNNLDNVNSNISNLESFTSDRDLGKETFITLNKGETTIRTQYVYFRESSTISVIGLALLIIYQAIVFVKEKEDAWYEEK